MSVFQEQFLSVRPVEILKLVEHPIAHCLVIAAPRRRRRTRQPILRHAMPPR